MHAGVIRTKIGILTFIAASRRLGDDAYTFLERTGIDVLEKIPKSLTEKEIIAIKKGRIFRGMSEDALLYCIGAPEKINNWGQGGQQNIYYSNTLYIYVAHGRVRDWQSLN